MFSFIFYSLSVVQGCQENQQESCVPHIVDHIFGYAELLTFVTLIYSDYYFNLIYVNDSGCFVSVIMSIIMCIV